MKTSPHPDDPLMRALTSDANELPFAAAAQARSRHRLRRAVSTVAAAAILLALGFWFGIRPAPNHAGNAGSNKNLAQSGAIVPGPAVVSAEEKKLLDELGDVPVLVVRNDTGHLRRVYVLEGAR